MKECEPIKEKILQSLRETGIISIACSQAGISRNTFYRWIKDDYYFSDDVNFAIDEGIYHVDDLARSKLLEHIKNGNWTAIKYRLDHAKSFESQKIDMIFKIIGQRSDSSLQNIVDK